MVRELNPKMKLWQELVRKNGIKGVLTKNNPLYSKIKDEYKELIKKM